MLCAACLRQVHASAYSKNQLKKGATRRRCPECITTDNPPYDVIALMLSISDNLPDGVPLLIHSYVGPDDPYPAALTTIINVVGPAAVFYKGDLKSFLTSPKFAKVMRSIFDSFKPYDMMAEKVAALRRENRSLRRKLSTQKERHESEISGIENCLQSQKERHESEISEIKNRLQRCMERKTRWKTKCGEARTANIVCQDHNDALKGGILGISHREGHV